jgi:hypothetical protein
MKFLHFDQIWTTLQCQQRLILGLCYSLTPSSAQSCFLISKTLPNTHWHTKLFLLDSPVYKKAHPLWFVWWGDSSSKETIFTISLAYFVYHSSLQPDKSTWLFCLSFKAYCKLPKPWDSVIQFLLQQVCLLIVFHIY